MPTNLTNAFTKSMAASMSKQALTPTADPAAAAGGMPMDPAMMGGAPAGAPADPAMAGAMPPAAPGMGIDPMTGAMAPVAAPAPAADPAAAAPAAADPYAKTLEKMEKRLGNIEAATNQLLGLIAGATGNTSLLQSGPVNNGGNGGQGSF